MATAKTIRRSVTLPRDIAKQVESISKQRRLSDNRVLVELIEQGLEAQKEKEKAFFALAQHFVTLMILRKSRVWVINWVDSCLENSAAHRGLIPKDSRHPATPRGAHA